MAAKVTIGAYGGGVASGCAAAWGAPLHQPSPPAASTMAAAPSLFATPPVVASVAIAQSPRSMIGRRHAGGVNGPVAIAGPELLRSSPSGQPPPCGGPTPQLAQQPLVAPRGLVGVSCQGHGSVQLPQARAAAPFYSLSSSAALAGTTSIAAAPRRSLPQAYRGARLFQGTPSPAAAAPPQTPLAPSRSSSSAATADAASRSPPSAATSAMSVSGARLPLHPSAVGPFLSSPAASPSMVAVRPRSVEIGDATAWPNEENEYAGDVAYAADDVAEPLRELLQFAADHLQERDNQIYRVVFETNPISDDVRKAGFGGANRYKNLEGFANSDLIISTTKRLDILSKQMVVQSKSFDEVQRLALDKEKLLAAIPSIQPVTNENLTRMASGFGWRTDPFTKARRRHKGMDFTAPRGTPIYATSDGVVKRADNRSSGYGRHIRIDHGYGYTTLYAHLSKYNVKRGQRVKRGDIIGYVGNTGRSQAPHLHYEVLKDGVAVNPINFYSGDLSPEEFEAMLEVASRENQSLD